MKRLLSALSLLPLLAACSGSEIVGLHVKLQADGAATITARALVDAPAPGRVEGEGAGVEWSQRAALVYSQGKAAKVEALRFGDDALSVTQYPEAKKLTVRLKRSPKAGWVTALVPDRPVRQKLAAVYDPLGKTKEIADTLRLEFELPTAVIGSSVLPSARGVEADRESNRAYLTIPVETARDNGEDLTWDITWQ